MDLLSAACWPLAGPVKPLDDALRPINAELPALVTRDREFY